MHTQCVNHLLTTESLPRVPVTYNEKSPETGISYPNSSPGPYPAAGSGTEVGPAPLGRGPVDGLWLWFIESHLATTYLVRR